MHLVYDGQRFHEIQEGGDFPAEWPLHKRFVTYFPHGNVGYTLRALFDLLRESPIRKWLKAARIMAEEFVLARKRAPRGWWGGHCFHVNGEMREMRELTKMPFRSRARAEAWLKEEWS